jgi:hypothetical protein
MTKLYWIIFLVCMLVSCQSKASPSASASASAAATTEAKASPTPAATQAKVSPSPASSPQGQATAAPAPTSNDSPEAEIRTTTALYESCTVYAGATDYYFKTDDGRMMQFRNSNFPDEKKAVEVSVDLIDREAGDGPPGANPEWVGRTFLLTLNEKDEIVAAEPVEEEEFLGESSPESAQSSLEAAGVIDSNPDLPVIVAIPDGFTSDFFGGHEGTAVMINGAGGQLHIFIPDPEISDTGDDSVIGEGGLLESNGWSTMEVGRQSQPSVDWASSTFPFFGPDELEGVVWLGDFGGTEVRVMASASSHKIDGFYEAIGPMVQTMQLRE